MLETFIQKFNQYRKKKYFENPLFATQKKYACIGLGVHSLANIYPILRHFNLAVKYICTRHSQWNKQAALLFPGCVFTHDISAILNDPEVEGVFVCASPDAHYSLVKALLIAGKKIFVEKPPCNSSAELATLVSLSGGNVCKIGLQRRYWPGNKPLFTAIRQARSYIYRFYFGPYLQGNTCNELFIHAIAYSHFLFGNSDILSTTFQKDQQGITVQLHLQHASGIAGMMELSTHYSWADPIEDISIQCSTELLKVQYPLQVEGIQKPKRLLNMPAERFLRQPVIAKKYFSSGSLIVPAMELNTLVLQGFYQELETFIRLVESGDSRKDENDLPGLLPVYGVLDKLNRLLYPTASA